MSRSIPENPKLHRTPTPESVDVEDGCTRTHREDPATLQTLIRRLEIVLEDSSRARYKQIDGLAHRILDVADHHAFDIYADLLNRACFSLFELGHSLLGIRLGKHIDARAMRVGHLQAQRRICNIIGGQYGDIADFASAMKYLERAIVLARKIGDPTIEAACLANTVAVLQEMGHYRYAISMAERVLQIDGESAILANLKLQCTSNALFAAHRVGDRSASRFLDLGQRYLDADIEPLRRAFFERARVLFLIDCDQAADAARHLQETRARIGNQASLRIETLLTIASSLCEWGGGCSATARLTLEALYIRTSSSKLYHHFVLQALIKVFSNAESQAAVATGLAYARELVEFTTSIKKAKFYRQLQARRDSTVTSPDHDRLARVSHISTAIDAIAASKEWLVTTQLESPSPVEPVTAQDLATHEELSAIHDDMARLRVAGLRRDIRTDAVDTAENWAIAAEFFDDETGRHCYRVGHLAGLLARQIGMDETFCVQVEHAARLHDIGKIAVNEVILLKPGPLDATEMAAMRLHTEVGAQILGGSDDPTLQMATEVARHHHEWWNGAGYPRRLAGRDIPLAARISAYADVYDALTHARAYKSAWTHERALAEITRLAGTQFDPELLPAFRDVIGRYLEDLRAQSIPGFADMDANALISSRRKLMETIAANG